MKYYLWSIMLFMTLVYTNINGAVNLFSPDYFAYIGFAILIFYVPIWICMRCYLNEQRQPMTDK
ncbi:MAG: hypothetical protein U0350_02540 [Caldilineaceae bacterium]